MNLFAKKLSLAEFLAWENEQATRHELIRGEVVAVADAQRVEGLVVGNLGLRCTAEVFRRNERSNFELIDQTGHDALALDSVAMRLPMSELFDGVGSPPA